MKKTLLSVVTVVVIIGAACSSSKKNSTSTTNTTTSTNVTTSKSATDVAASKGIFAPGQEQLAAAQMKYKDVTMQTLSNGHSIYTGVCTDCHAAKAIYSRDEVRWEKIIDVMAKKSKLTDQQKDELTKYVMSIKATQPK